MSLQHSPLISELPNDLRFVNNADKFTKAVVALVLEMKNKNFKNFNDFEILYVFSRKCKILVIFIFEDLAASHHLGVILVNDIHF